MFTEEICKELVPLLLLGLGVLTLQLSKLLAGHLEQMTHAAIGRALCINNYFIILLDLVTWLWCGRL